MIGLARNTVRPGRPCGHTRTGPRYQALKQKLAAEHSDDRKAYQNRKDVFIQQVLERNRR